MGVYADNVGVAQRALFIKTAGLYYPDGGRKWIDRTLRSRKAPHKARLKLLRYFRRAAFGPSNE